MSDHDFVKARRAMMSTIGKMRKEMPGAMGAFGQLNKEASLSDGALTVKDKEMIALGIAVAVRCDDCIASHMDDVLRHGATREEIMECLGVAVLMGGGPAVMSAAKAYEAMEQFEAARKSG